VQPEEQASKSVLTAAERRTERRHAADGHLKFCFDDPAHREVTGRLLDYSKSGFRAAHSYTALSTGQIVDFQHVVAVGQARVMWNRIAGDRVESGFLIIK
jgi:hypothetical protein